MTGCTMTKADFSKAAVLYPSTAMNDAAWIKVFDAEPQIMWAILADVFTVAIAEQDRDAGSHTSGRRRSRAADSVEDFRNVVFPDYWNREPFPAALRALMGGRSQNQFARKVPVSQATLSRMLSGQQTPD